MRLVTQIIVGSLQGLLMVAGSDCALAAAAASPASCLSAGSAGIDADTIKVDAVSLPATVKCAGEEQFLGELKKRIWLAFIARARPRLLPRYDYDGQMGAPVATAECAPSFALEESGGNDIADLAALEAVAAALAAGTPSCDLASYTLKVRFEPSRESDQARVGPVACVLLHSESPELRTLAAEGLGSMRSYVAKRATAALRQAESDPDPRVQQAVRTAEEQINNRAKQRRPTGPAPRPR